MHLSCNDELVAFDSRNCANEQVVLGIRSIDDVGQRQYEKYVENVLERRNTSFLAPIKKNKIAIFRSKCKKEMPLKLRQQPTIEYPENFHTRFIDGAGFIHNVLPKNTATFDEYHTQQVQACIIQSLETCTRLDIVWERYLEKSLKDVPRESRGAGIRRKVSESAKIPGNFRDFLSLSDNKRELFSFLSYKLVAAPLLEGKSLFVTNENFQASLLSILPLTRGEISMESDEFALIERFVCVVYERCTEAVKRRSGEALQGLSLELQIPETGVGFLRMNPEDPTAPTYQMQVKQFPYWLSVDTNQIAHAERTAASARLWA
eukprot:gene1931-2195_t